MRNLAWGMLCILLISLVACQNEREVMTDDDLIEAIQEATGKEAISLSDLPESARETVEREYTVRSEEEVFLTREYGYEVTLLDRVERFQSLYFDLEGRRLHRGDRAHDREEDGKEKCFEFVYPLTYTMPDNSSLTGNSEKELDSLVRVWYAANPNEDAKPQIQFPVDIMWRDGRTATLSSTQQLRRAYRACHDDRERDKECYEYVYPLTFTMPDGSSITGSTKRELDSLIKAWYRANPNEDQRPTIQYPFDVLLANGNTATITGDSTYRRLQRSCHDQDDAEKDCFDFVYPLSYLMPDGSIIIGNDKDQLWTDIEAWYSANPNEDTRPLLQFPVDIIYRDGTTVTLQNETELERAKNGC